MKFARPRRGTSRGPLPRQAEVNSAVQQVRGDLKKIAQETTPLLEQRGWDDKPRRSSGSTAKPSRFWTPDNGFRKRGCRDTNRANRLGRRWRRCQSAVIERVSTAVRKAAGPRTAHWNTAANCITNWPRDGFFMPGNSKRSSAARWCENTGLKRRQAEFQATHGKPAPSEVPDIHEEQWTVVGVMKPTHTAADRCLYIPLITFYCIAEHDVGVKVHGQFARARRRRHSRQADETGRKRTIG